MTPTPEQRTKLKAAAEAAAPGPWISYETIVRFDGDMPGGINASHCPRPKETASFIALANPETILALLAEIEALESRVASAEGATSAAHDVLAERERQQSVEGWTPEHDDKHDQGQMAGAAVCYLVEDIPHWARSQAHGCYWPWDAEWWKPASHRRNLVKAAALILAEIERLDRAARAHFQSQGGDHGRD